MQIWELTNLFIPKQNKNDKLGISYYTKTRTIIHLQRYPSSLSLCMEIQGFFWKMGKNETKVEGQLPSWAKLFHLATDYKSLSKKPIIWN